MYKFVRSGDIIELYEYRNNMTDDFQLLSAFIPHTKTQSPRFKHRNSVNRAATRIRRLIDCNVGEYGEVTKFVTFTFAEHVWDLKEANRLFSRFTQRLNYRLKTYGYERALYLSVPEFTGRGRVHYHVLYFNIPYISDIKSLFSEVWSYGFVKVIGVKHIKSLPAYLTKYLKKGITDSRLYGKKVYTTSRGLKQPEVLRFESYPQEEFDKYGILHKERDEEYSAGLFGDVHYRRYRGRLL